MSILVRTFGSTIHVSYLTSTHRTGLTGDGHPWIAGNLWYSRLSTSGLLTGSQGINNSRSGGCLVVELCCGRHGSRSCRHRRRRRSWGHKAARGSSILMMVSQCVINHRISSRRGNISRETCGVPTGLVTASGGINSRCSRQGCTRCSWRPKTWDHAWCGPKSSSRYSLMLLMMMMGCSHRNVRIHAWGGARRRWCGSWTSWVLRTWARRTRGVVLSVINCRRRNSRRGQTGL